MVGLVASRAPVFATIAVACAVGASVASWGLPPLRSLFETSKPACAHCGSTRKGPLDIPLLAPEWEAARQSLQHRLRDVAVWESAEVGEVLGMASRAAREEAIVPTTESTRGAGILHCWIIQDIGRRLAAVNTVAAAVRPELNEYLIAQLSSPVPGVRYNAAGAVFDAGLATRPEVFDRLKSMEADPDARTAARCKRLLGESGD